MSRDNWLSDVEIVAQKVQDFSSIKIVKETSIENLWYHERTNSDVLSDYHATLETDKGETFEIHLDSSYDDGWEFECVHPVLLPSSLAAMYNFYCERIEEDSNGWMGDHIDVWFAEMASFYEEQAVDPMQTQLKKAKLNQICQNYKLQLQVLTDGVRQCLVERDVKQNNKVVSFFSQVNTWTKTLDTIIENPLLDETEYKAKAVLEEVYKGTLDIQTDVFEEMMYGHYNYDSMKGVAQAFRVLKDYTMHAHKDFSL